MRQLIILIMILSFTSCKKEVVSPFLGSWQNQQTNELWEFTDNEVRIYLTPTNIYRMPYEYNETTITLYDDALVGYETLQYNYTINGVNLYIETEGNFIKQ